MEEVKQFIENKNIEFVRLECEDINGVSRGMLLDAHIFANSGMDGVAMFEPMFSISTNGEFINGTGVMEEVDYRNGFMYPDLKTFNKLPWSPNEASVLVEFRLKSGDPQSIPSAVHSRMVCKKQLDKLAEKQISFLAAFEYEFYLLNSETKQTLFPDNNFGSIQTAIKEKQLIFDIMRHLKAMDIPPETFHAEYGPAQHEITLCPAFGIKCADNAFRFKQLVKEVTNNHGYTATFMAKPFLNVSGSSGHFNHSLWSLDGKTNLFYDKDRPNHLSEMMEHWLAGLRAHANSLMALANMTPNCYERIRPHIFAPVNNAWGIDNRSCAYRVKNYDHSQTYIENRMAGGAVNPYILTAGHIIAGLDGINRKLKLDSLPVKGDAAKPENQTENISPLPLSLNDSLKALENDEVMVDQLGADFVKCFCTLKRTEQKRMEENEKNVDIGAWYRENYAKFI